jgi:hypothetical protein
MVSSSLVRKIEKAKDYAEQRDRVRFIHCQAEFRGDNSEYTICYEAGIWECTCHYFSGHNTCSHTMAMEMMLDGMLPKESAAIS